MKNIHNQETVEAPFKRLFPSMSDSKARKSSALTPNKMGLMNQQPYFPLVFAEYIVDLPLTEGGGLSISLQQLW
jgi:hypothetical protein